MRDAKKDLAGLREHRRSGDITVGWLRDKLESYILGWVEQRKIGMELVEKLNEAEAREGELWGLANEVRGLLYGGDTVQAIARTNMALRLRQPRPRPAILDRLEELEQENEQMRKVMLKVLHHLGYNADGSQRVGGGGGGNNGGGGSDKSPYGAIAWSGGQDQHKHIVTEILQALEGSGPE